jgi:hypothetical protein
VPDLKQQISQINQTLKIITLLCFYSCFWVQSPRTVSAVGTCSTNLLKKIIKKIFIAFIALIDIQVYAISSHA